MFKPKYSKKNRELLDKIGEIERIKFRIERMLIMPKHEQWLRREAFIRTAYSSTMIENGTIPEEEMERVAQASPTAEIPKNRPDIVNYAKALDFVDFLSDFGDSDVPLEAIIRQIHWHLMSGVHDTHIQPGTYRTIPNWIEYQGVKVYESPFHVDVPILMREFSFWFGKDESIHPIIQAGIAHAHMIAIHPFVDGNGRTARLLATLLLQGSGYGFKKLLSLDSYYQRNRDEYLQALRQSIGERFTIGYNLTPWLDFFAKSIITQGQLLERKLTDWRISVDELHREFVDSGLTERQLDGLLYAANIGYITRKDYMEIANVSPLTATRDLQYLVKEEYLAPQGKGRNRRYIFIEVEETEEEKAQQKLL